MSWILATAAAPFSPQAMAIVLFSLAAGCGLLWVASWFFDRWCYHKEKMAVLTHKDCDCRNSAEEKA